MDTMRKVITWTLVIVLSAALGAAAVVGIDSLRSNGSKPVIIERAVPPSATGVENTSPVQDVSDLYDKVRPTVVRVQGTSSRNAASGLGSGVVLDKQGDVLTNFHVVRGFDQIDVTFADGTAVKAKVVGTDPGNDLAVVRVTAPPDNLKPAILGDSDAVRPGEVVIAVGNPFSLDGSITEGIVSGIGRMLNDGAGGRPLRQLIQSDAAINPGNSGGALFNARGEVIGITTAIENPSGERVFVGIGYAIPINTARRFLPDLLAGRVVLHARLGVSLRDITPVIAATLGLNVDAGVLITAIDSTSAAAKGGLRGGDGSRRGQVGDVIIGLDDKKISDYNDLANFIDTKNVGDRVQVKYVRDGREATATIVLDAWTGTTPD